MRRNLAISAFAVLAIVLSQPFALAQPVTNTLTGEQVSCNESQLSNLLQRLTLVGTNDTEDARSLNLFVTYSNPFGFFEGLAVANQKPIQATTPVGGTRPETFLAFSLNPSIRTTLLNPTRQRLPQVSLVREEPASNLVSPSSPDVLTLLLNPTLADQGGAGRLEINNIDVTGSNASCSLRRDLDVKPGRGLILAGLTTACHTELTEFDRFVFEILERTLRVQSPGNASQDFKVAIFRGENNQVYRIDIYPVGVNGATSGRIALELALTTDVQSRLQTGTLSVLPACASALDDNCTSSNLDVDVYVFAPVLGGTQIRRTSDPFAKLSIRNGVPTPSITVSWADILENTPWND
jgi:hypothetical protein